MLGERGNSENWALGCGVARLVVLALGRPIPGRPELRSGAESPLLELGGEPGIRVSTNEHSVFGLGASLLGLQLPASMSSPAVKRVKAVEVDS